MPIISTIWRRRATSSAQDLGLLVEHRPRLGTHLLGEARDQVGVEPVGLGQTADRARVGWAKD
jgi:hypothetical protein